MADPTKKISGISAKIEKKMGFVIYKHEFELICIKITKIEMTISIWRTKM